MLRSTLPQSRIGWVWVSEGVLAVAPRVRSPGHDVMHITDGAIAEESLVGGTQHPQPIALSLEHHARLSILASLAARAKRVYAI